ncbi:hypothetical protein [Hymenobacter gummosus]|nr:hypothetical protein [Hymenobacter gummosus]
MYSVQTQPELNQQQPDLAEGLFVLELEERLELAAVAVEAADCRRCDVTD